MTFPTTGEDRTLAAAMTTVIEVAHRTEGRDAVRAASAIRNALVPGNGARVAEVPPGRVRQAVARCVRAVADEGHPEAARLREMAAELLRCGNCNALGPCPDACPQAGTRQVAEAGQPAADPAPEPAPLKPAPPRPPVAKPAS